MKQRIPKAADQMFCFSCGAIVNKEAEICPNCGVRQDTGAGVKYEKDKTTAGVLALFLGGIGVHRFYIGNPAIGVVYLLFCWTYIPAILGLVEAILYFVKSDEEFRKKKGRLLF
jgi:TM2 domain-containing membrane protein YozV